MTKLTQQEIEKEIQKERADFVYLCNFEKEFIEKQRVIFEAHYRKQYPYSYQLELDRSVVDVGAFHNYEVSHVNNLFKFFAIGAWLARAELAKGGE